MGIKDGADGGEVQFIIYGDGKGLWRSRTVIGGEQGRNRTDKFEVSIRRVKKLELDVDSLGDTRYDWAVWVDPVLIR